MENNVDKVRINKYLADKGLSTRRGADALIEAGKVFVNGTRAVLGQKVGPEDKVEVKGGEPQAYRYVAYNKPAGYVTHSPACAADGATGRPVPVEKQIADIFDMEGLFPVGRLDKNSEGLILLTNDGRITDRLLNPKYDHEKEYSVEISTAVSPSFAKKLESGVNIGEGDITKPCKVSLLDAHHFTIALTEGKKHQIKRMTEALGVSVVSLKRLRVMNIKLGNQKPNTGREISGKELQTFLKTLGLSS
ncbi:MAG: pseudouridine synthase [bacterium]|nr:pseudouridine synthase [bacterium]